MPWATTEQDGHMPRGLACLHCRYDLAGLNWGTRCPECGFRAPTAWPTISLGEAHPAFITHLHDRFRDLWHVDVCLASALLALATAITLGVLHANGAWISFIALGGVALLAMAGLYGCITLARLSARHRNARENLDFPHRKAILWSLVFTAAPLGVLVLSFFFAIVMVQGIWCIIVPALLTSAIAAICLIVHTAEHASTTIERTGNSPRWTRPERVTAIITACWPAAILVFWAYFGGAGVAVSIMVFVAMLCIIHALRMRHAQKIVRRTLRQRLGQFSTAPTSPEPT